MSTAAEEAAHAVEVAAREFCEAHEALNYQREREVAFFAWKSGKPSHLTLHGRIEQGPLAPVEIELDDTMLAAMESHLQRDVAAAVVARVEAFKRLYEAMTGGGQ